MQKEGAAYMAAADFRGRSRLAGRPYFGEDEEKVMQAKKRLYVGLLGFSLIMVIGIVPLSGTFHPS